MSDGGGDNVARSYITEVETEDRKMANEKFVGGLKVIELPPIPKDFCTVCDPVMKTDLRMAVFTTFFCWLPLGIVPVIFGLLSIYFAVKAKRAKSREIRDIYSARSVTISWIGMMLFVTILSIGIIIIATCGIL